MQCSQWVENAQWKDSSDSSDRVKEICVLSQKLCFYWGRKLLDFVHHMVSDAPIVSAEFGDGRGKKWTSSPNLNLTSCGVTR